MALREKVSDDDIALLDVIEDSVFLGEFLRNTANGETNKELWPKGPPFAYRNYQREWLTDTSPYVCVTAGRAVGKCSLSTTRVYTDRGYRTIHQLKDLPSFYTYALDKNGQMVIRRAKVYFNKYDAVYTLSTESGKTIDVTKNHPFLTPSGDWVEVKKLKAGDYVAVSTRLPELKNNYYFQWHELRWLGYMLLRPNPGAEVSIKLRFRKQVAEMRLIAKRFNVYLATSDDSRTVQLKRRPGYTWAKNNATWLLRELGYSHKLSNNSTRQLPIQLMELPNKPLKVFLEALFSQHAALSLTDVSLTYPYKIVIQQIQEMLLRFGIETRIEKGNETFMLSLYDARAIYRFYTTFDLPGVAVNTLPLPPPDNDFSEHIRFEPVTSIVQKAKQAATYAVYVYEDHNYISDNIYVHNSLVLEDKVVYEIINADKEFPVTKEQLLTTANQAQLNPILDRLITRFSNGKLLKDFLQNQVNKSQGTMKFPPWNFIFTARIAAGKGESNLVGLHLPRIKIDEAQLFGGAAYSQLIPSLNQWEPKTQVMVTGVNW